MTRRLIRPLTRLLGLAPLALLAAGCSSLEPFDWTALPSRSVTTLDGRVLEASDGELRVRHAPDDLGAALGVGLEETGDGVLVTNRLRADAELVPGDRIRAVAAVAGAAVESPVEGVADLEQWLVASGWLELDLRVDRDGSEEVVRVLLRNEAQPVPAVTSTRARRWGIDLVDLRTLPEGAWPGRIDADDMEELVTSTGTNLRAYLVSRIAVDSPAAYRGLRPLDVVLEVSSDGLDATRLVVVGADGRDPWTLELDEPESPAGAWIPLLFEYERDESATLLSIGPRDEILGLSSTRSYDADTDGYVERRVVSSYALFDYTRTSTPTGTQTTIEVLGLPSFGRLWRERDDD